MEWYLEHEVYKDMRITDALTETCIVSFSITEQEPRLYSKFFAKLYPEKYDVTLFHAAAATSAAPGYWDLKWV